MKKVSIIIISFLLSCNSRKAYNEVVQTKEVDKDIVLINIENGNRAQIAQLIEEIQQCDPLMIGIDVIFSKNKTNYEDSLLEEAIAKIEKGVIAFRLSANGQIENPIERL